MDVEEGSRKFKEKNFYKKIGSRYHFRLSEQKKREKNIEKGN